MTTEWNKTALEDAVISPITYGVVKPGPFVLDGVLFVRGGDISAGKIAIDCLRTISEEVSEQYRRTRLEGGELLVSLVGNPGEVAIAPPELAGANIARQVGLVRLSEQLSARYVQYFLMSPQGKEELATFIGGSVQQVINLKDLKKLVINHPKNRSGQEAIAEVLSSLDDKIDLLHRQNTTLEALAETLFRRYFIEGAQDDWEESTLDDVLTVKGGTTPSTSNAAFWDGDIHWTSPKDLSANDGLFLLDTARKITPEGLAQIGSGLLPAGSLLMSSRAPVGYLAFSVNPVAINQGYIGILDDKGFSKEFIFLWLKINMEYVKGHANGSTFQEISKSTFKRLEITKPPEQLRQEFQGLVLPLFQKLLENTLQCQKLRQLRDTLLPKLMSGQVRVDVSA